MEIFNAIPHTLWLAWGVTTAAMATLLILAALTPDSKTGKYEPFICWNDFKITVLVFIAVTAATLTWINWK